MCKDCCAQRLKQVVIHISGVPSLPKMFAFMPQPSNLSLMQRCQLPYDYFLAVCSVLLAQKQCILKPCILYNTNKKPHAEKRLIKMPFGVWTRVVSGNSVLDFVIGIQILPGKGHFSREAYWDMPGSWCTQSDLQGGCTWRCGLLVAITWQLVSLLVVSD